MTRPFPFEILRPDSPTKPSFTVSEVPYKAKLDQNETPFDIPEEAKQPILEALADEHWNRYPQPTRYAEIKERFASTMGLKPERVVLTVGCDQMILLAYWAAAGPGRTARLFEPTYPMFAAYAKTTRTTLDSVVLGPSFDLTAEALGSPVNLLMLVSPNNPTGNGPGRCLISNALERDCLVFVDEAYADYSGESVIDLVQDHPNLLVGRSLSKAALAGTRLGFGVGHPDLINVLEQLLFAPYHLNALQLLIARYYDIIKPHLDSMVRTVIEDRERVSKAMQDVGLKVWPSKANFLLFEVESAQRTYRGLLDHGVRIRNVSSMPGMGEHLRVTIGTREENDLFLEAIALSV